MNRDTISIIITALNEEDNLLQTYDKVKRAIDGRFADYEMIIFNDGSTDDTGKIVDEIARTNPKVRAMHHPRPMNLGYVYKSGIKMARMEYLMLVTGDNDVEQKAFEDTFDLRNKADMVIPFHLNERSRPLWRQIISKGFVQLVNLAAGLRLKYYNGMVLHKTSIISSIAIKTDSFAYQAEALVKLLKRGYGYIEVGIYLLDRKKGHSKAFRIKNIIGILKSVFDILRGG